LQTNLKVESILSFGGFKHRYARKLDLSKKSTSTREIVSLNQKKAGQQGRWALSINVLALTASILQWPLKELTFTTRQTICSIRQPTFIRCMWFRKYIELFKAMFVC
jgi:hypothetical protein